MAMFLNIQQAYRLFQRELPDGVYADGAPSAFFTTASVYSKANLVAEAYTNMSRIYANYFPQTADESIDDWVIKAFGVLFPDGTLLQDKRDRVTAQIRKQPRITQWEILTLVASYVPENVFVQVFAPCGDDKFWTLGQSLLGIGTFLGPITPESLGIPADEWCSAIGPDNWRLGISTLGDETFLAIASFADISQIQDAAYGYFIRIFGYTLPPDQLAALDKAVTQAEPARSGHRIFQNQNLNDFNLTVTVNNVDQFSLIDTIARDPTQTTGYLGRST